MERRRRRNGRAAPDGRRRRLLRACGLRGGRGGTLYAHNLPLEIWAELGPLGLALAVVLFASTAALVWRLRSERRAWLLAPAVLAFPLANLVDWTWHLAGAAALWAAALGALLAIDAERRQAQSTNASSA